MRAEAAKPYGPVDDERRPFQNVGLFELACAMGIYVLTFRSSRASLRRMPISKWLDSNSSTQVGQALQAVQCGKSHASMILGT